MKCKAVIREIEELERDASLSTETAAHLLACKSCSAFSRERAALKLLVGGLDKVTAPPDFDWRLKARLAEARSEKASERRFLPGFAPGAQAITLAACVTLLLVGVVIYRQTRPLLPSKETQSASIAGMDNRANPASENKGTPTEGSAPRVASESVAPPASSEPRRARNIKSVRTNATKTEGSRESGPRERIYSNDMGSSGAKEVTTQRNVYNASAPVIYVSLPSAQSAQLKVEDGQGTRRTLSPINFGGQDSIERPDKARLVRVSEKGIW